MNLSRNLLEFCSIWKVTQIIILRLWSLGKKKAACTPQFVKDMKIKKHKLLNCCTEFVLKFFLKLFWDSNILKSVEALLTPCNLISSNSAGFQMCPHFYSIFFLEQCSILGLQKEQLKLLFQIPRVKADSFCKEKLNSLF